MKLTQRRIETLECPEGTKDILVFDDEQRGLGVRVTRGGETGSLGGKSYLAQYTLAGQKRRVPLGACGAVTLAAARAAARSILGDVAKGRDPAAERKEAAREARRKAAEEALTFEALLGQWEVLHLADKRERYALEAVRALRHTFSKHLDEPASSLDRATVVHSLDALAKKGRAAMASRTAAYGRACFQWAVKRGSLTSNPFQNLPLASVAKRERVLTDDELRAIWQATDGPGPFNAIVRMLILTGQRREEVAAMVWDEIASDLMAWTLPASRAKNGATHVVPLSAQAQDILRKAPRLANDDKCGDDGGGDRRPALVFAGQRGSFNGFSKSKASLDKDSGVTAWRLHDLRRTLATGLQKLGVRLEVTEAVLNHVSGSRAGIVGVYQRHEWKDEKTAALNAWAAHITAIVEKREPDAKVVPFARSA